MSLYRLPALLPFDDPMLLFEDHRSFTFLMFNILGDADQLGTSLEGKWKEYDGPTS
ncbi:hypothetical protein COMA2_80025 [Candidatus Nitrospira nitrificans]|uniref:Uncharacterized protein n=1 Tax=Candidatus Nitrospira nitrificans TaxID=1742973 RepID=A0A0S4LWW6_9BACT|nr:hypothetical protein COMA2_80025 [Candidatus Nitrospira nitrificans]